MIKQGMLRQICEFFADDMISDEWLLDHVSVSFDDRTKTVNISVDNMNDQEYRWLKEEDGS